MTQRKPPSVVKVSSSLSIHAIFVRGIYSKWHMNVQRQLSSSAWWNVPAAPAPKAPHSAPTCSAILLLLDTDLKDYTRTNMYVNALTRD